MTTTHRVINFIAGDDWQINVQLRRQDGEPFNLNTTTVKWLIHNAAGEIVPHEVVVKTLNAAEGRLAIWIPAIESSKFAGGIYTDWLRVVFDNITSTLLTGPLSVTADPWRAAEVAPARTVVEIPDIVVTFLDRKERVKRVSVANDDEGFAEWSANPADKPDNSLPMLRPAKTGALWRGR